MAECWGVFYRKMIECCNEYIHKEMQRPSDKHNKISPQSKLNKNKIKKTYINILYPSR